MCSSGQACHWQLRFIPGHNLDALINDHVKLFTLLCSKCPLQNENGFVPLKIELH